MSECPIPSPWGVHLTGGLPQIGHNFYTTNSSRRNPQSDVAFLKKRQRKATQFAFKKCLVPTIGVKKMEFKTDGIGQTRREVGCSPRLQSAGVYIAVGFTSVKYEQRVIRMHEARSVRRFCCDSVKGGRGWKKMDLKTQQPSRLIFPLQNDHAILMTARWNIANINLRNVG